MEDYIKETKFSPKKVRQEILELKKGGDNNLDNLDPKELLTEDLKMYFKVTNLPYSTALLEEFEEYRKYIPQENTSRFDFGACLANLLTPKKLLYEYRNKIRQEE